MAYWLLNLNRAIGVGIINARAAKKASIGMAFVISSPKANKNIR